MRGGDRGFPRAGQLTRLAELHTLGSNESLASTCTCTHTCTHTYTCAHTHVLTYTLALTHAYALTHALICTQAPIHMPMHIYKKTKQKYMAKVHNQGASQASAETGMAGPGCLVLEAKFLGRESYSVKAEER